MPSVLRKGDSAGGALKSSQSTVKANGKNIIVDGDDVKNHGDSPHNAATITAGSNNVFIGGVAVANSGDEATCEHVGSSSSNVKVG
jgi:uncharacterized Zn-binding protein involved in type VI secretion